MATIFPKVYGVPLSQPFRSVVWLLLQKHVPFSVQLTVPGAKTRIGTLHESYITKTGVTTIPVLQTDESTYIPESPAILKYLCESNDWSDLYPTGQNVVMLDAYLHWHHSNTRNLSKLIRPFLRSDASDEALSDKDQEDCHKTLTSLNDFWLQPQGWIIASHRAQANPNMTIADVLAYEEIVQLTMTRLITNVDQDYPNLHDWMKRMEQVEFHDEIHAPIVELGILGQDDDAKKNMKDALGRATKVGMSKIKEAQESYVGKESKL